MMKRSFQSKRQLAGRIAPKTVSVAADFCEHSKPLNVLCRRHTMFNFQFEFEFSLLLFFLGAAGG
jgi:hypothetical protein